MMLSVRPVDSEAHNVKDVTSVVTTVTAEDEGKIIADVPPTTRTSRKTIPRIKTHLHYPFHEHLIRRET
jgi:hypothetical protein